MAKPSTPQNGGSRPVPDPTVLTTELIDRAAKAQRDWVEGQISILTERLHGIDEATRLRLQTIDHMPSIIDEKVGNLSALTGVEFARIAQQFAERDIRSEREARDNKVAVDAAFAAQKEAAAKQDEGNNKAIDKSEKATTETINKLAELFATSNKALSDKILDNAARIDRVESLGIGTTVGAASAKEAQATARTLIFTVITILLGMATIGASILAATR